MKVAPPGLKFSVDSHLVGELGERLVAQDHVALSELVKNSYDAEATEVSIDLRDAASDEEDGEIVIRDNGHGMTFQQVNDFWMRVATPNKLDSPVTKKFGRQKTGNKGIGRFACQRLAEELQLTTTGRVPGSKDSRAGSFEETTLTIKWSEFERGKDLTQIPCAYSVKPMDAASTGFQLKLTKLRDIWTQRDVDVLRRQLLMLTVVRGEERPGFRPDPGFKIVLVTPEFAVKALPLAEQFMDGGWGRLTGSIDRNGIGGVRLEAKELEPAHYKLPREFPLLRGISLDIAIVPRVKGYYRDPKILTLGAVDEVLDEWSGVKVYLDGFRVYPYGDKGDDWLGVDRDVAQSRTPPPRDLKELATGLLGVESNRAMLHHPKNQNLVGGVHLTTRADFPFIVKSNREGFVENEAASSLVDFCRLALDWATLYYAQFVFLQLQKGVERSATELAGKLGVRAPVNFREDPVRGTISALNDSISVLRQNSTATQFKEVKDTLGDGVRILDGYVDQYRHELSSLRVTASSGSILLAFSHEVREVVAQLGSIAGQVEDLSPLLPRAERTDFVKFAQTLRATQHRLENQLEFFGVITKQAGQSKRERLNLAEICKDVVDRFRGLLREAPPIDYAGVPGAITTSPMYRGELTSVMLNLLTNATKAVLSVERKNKGIKLQARKLEKWIEIDVLDDGVGVPDSYLSNLPTVFTSDPEDKIYQKLAKRVGRSDLLLLGEGSGLGLTIVRSILSNYNGNLTYVKPAVPWRSCARIRLPR